ncbi:MAG: sugar ABC transporter ATP-binding protein [Syntrophomonadaceae bacterium]|nr:sugar ABC transporter ATP-binding protein [Syntrophomonadaceae bacterium]
MQHITKQYPGVLALDDVSLDFYEGETHALVGENGAGKSTFIKVLSGAIRPDEGEIHINGFRYNEITPLLARSLGIEVIYQEFNLMPALSVAENIFVGNIPAQYGIVNRMEMERRAAGIFESMGVFVDPQAPVADLSMAYMQLVEIAKALSKNVRILIMDEPTAPLTKNEVEILFRLMKRLHEKHVTIIYISHRLNEIFQISDRVSIIRDGQKIGTYLTADMSREKLIWGMVGREITDTFPKSEKKIGDVVMRVDKLCGNGVQDVSFELHGGEILGFGGLVGAGRTEIMRVLFGADMRDSGAVWLSDKEFNARSPYESIAAGVVLIPEDRKRQGVVLNLTIADNIALPNLDAISHFSVINGAAERKLVGDQMTSLRIVAPSAMQKVRNLSGGNQQKVVLAKWLAGVAKILIFDEPTRGIDVGVKQEIYKLMHSLCEKGIAIIMISSDMEELLGMSDRIIVLCEGTQEGILQKENFSQEAVLSLASGKQ